MTNPLFTGTPLDAASFADFIARLRHDCVGAGVDEHCTADVIFLVESKERLYGIDLEYAQNLAIYAGDDTYYNCAVDFMIDYRSMLIEQLDALCQKHQGKPFDQVDEHEQMLEIGELDGFTVLGYHDSWKLVAPHFTQSSADAFVAKHGHKYDGELRISQESAHRSFEFNAIKNALLDGKLVWKE